MSRNLIEWLIRQNIPFFAFVFSLNDVLMPKRQLEGPKILFLIYLSEMELSMNFTSEKERADFG